MAAHACSVRVHVAAAVSVSARDSRSRLEVCRSAAGSGSTLLAMDGKAMHTGRPGTHLRACAYKRTLHAARGARVRMHARACNFEFLRMPQRCKFAATPASDSTTISPPRGRPGRSPYACCHDNVSSWSSPPRLLLHCQVIMCSCGRVLTSVFSLLAIRKIISLTDFLDYSACSCAGFDLSSCQFAVTWP